MIVQLSTSIKLKLALPQKFRWFGVKISVLAYYTSGTIETPVGHPEIQFRSVLIVKLSIAIGGDKSINEYVALAKTVEKLGFHTLSIYDDLLFKPAWPILSVIAANTSDIRVGPAVVNPFLIHPVITAGNIAVLDEISNGRSYLGIGKGAFLDFVGLKPTQPIKAVRETIEITKGLLSGTLNGYCGDVFNISDATALRWEPINTSVPIMVGTWGNQMAELAGMLADEVKVSPLWNAQYASKLLGAINRGMLRAERKVNNVDLCLGVLTSVSHDEVEAREIAKRSLAIYLPHLSPMTDFVGVSMEEIKVVSDYSSIGCYSEAAKWISDQTLESFALYGTPEQLCRKIQKMIDTVSVDRIEFGTPHGPDAMNAINMLGEKVLPWFH